MTFLTEFIQERSVSISSVDGGKVSSEHLLEQSIVALRRKAKRLNFNLAVKIDELKNTVKSCYTTIFSYLEINAALNANFGEHERISRLVSRGSFFETHERSRCWTTVDDHASETRAFNVFKIAPKIACFSCLRLI